MNGLNPSGQVRMNAVAGPRMAHGTGRFNSVRGSGTWCLLWRLECYEGGLTRAVESLQTM
jgi:hypothetical protein